MAAWDTSANPRLLSTYLEAFEDVCNSTEKVTGLKMPDYIVMSAKTPVLFSRFGCWIPLKVSGACGSVTRLRWLRI